jgi:methylaspartate mutase sigma subunit
MNEDPAAAMLSLNGHHDRDVAGECRLVILGVAASDSHAVANHLIAYLLRARGFAVINLGSCTPISEFGKAFQRNPDAEAVIIGSLNGHAFEDLCDLKDARATGLIMCPVIVGGNLSVGSRKDEADIRRLYGLGVDHVLENPRDLPSLLDWLHLHRSLRRSVLNRRVS